MPDTDRKRRVAIVYPFFAHYREAVLRELQHNGRHSYVLAGDERDPDDSIPTLSAAEFDFVHAPCIRLPKGLLWQRGLLRLACRDDIDCYIFLGNAAFIATWISAIVARLRGRRVLFWTHGWLKHERGVKALIRTAFYRLAHGLLLYGHNARRIAIAHGLSPARLHVIYNSLDVRAQQQLLAQAGREELLQLRQKLFGSIEKPVVIAVGRFTAVKRYDLLLRAVGALARSGHHVGVLLVGTGPTEQQLRDIAREENIQVVFHGACYEEAELARLFAIANVTVSPGNVGLTCMHSFGYGVPVITHDDPGEQMPEWEAIAPSVTGQLFRKNSADDLATAIRQWTASPTVNENTRQMCLRMIESCYHPAVQRRLIEAAIDSVSEVSLTPSVRASPEPYRRAEP